MRRFLVAAVLTISAIGLVGCTASGASSDSTHASDSGPANAVPRESGTGSKAVGAAVPSADAGRQVITTGSVSITVEKPAAAADAAVRIVERAGGRVDGRSEQAPTENGPGSAKLTVRIPSTRLTATIDALKELGTLEDIDLSSQDVTAQAQDLDARITALRASVDRLVELMSRATTTADLITIESALSDRQGNLESLESQKRSIDDQVDLSTITLQLGTAATAPKRVPATFLSGLIAGWDSFVGFLSGLLVVVGVLLPWIVFLALIALLSLIVVRRGIARRARAASGASTTAVE